MASFVYIRKPDSFSRMVINALGRLW